MFAGILEADSKAILLTVLATIVGAAIATIAPYAFLSSRPKNFPPGPTTIPIFGNLHLVPPTKSFTL
jgi:hypothetical protein